jgi:hypothetical protein
MPLFALPLGYFTGFLGIMVGGALGLFRLHYINGVASCAAAFQIFAGVPGRRKFSRLEIVLVVLALVVAVFAVRPVWLAIILSHLPLYRSLRWPFRETYIFLFFVHLFIALRPVTMKPRTFAISGIVGAAVFFASLMAAGPWSFSPMQIDRELLMTGKADAYWARLKPEFGPDDYLITLVEPYFSERQHEIPYTLLGAFNFPSLFKVHSISGYGPQGLRRAHGTDEVASEAGFFTLAAGKRMMAKNAHLKALHLVSLDPPSIEFCTAAGCRPLEVPSYTLLPRRPAS